MNKKIPPAQPKAKRLDKQTKATIADVARMAGVSVTTVSRILNGEKYVREDKRQAVNRAVAKLEYRPNLYARSLGGDKSYLIGLLFDDPQGDYLSGMQRGALQKCKEAGYHMVVEVFDRTSTLEQIESFLSSLRLSGVILTPPVCDNEVMLAALDKKKVPTVRIAPAFPYRGMAAIKIDDYGAAFRMTEYLIDLGHREIGFISGDIEHGDARERQRAFTDAMAKNGLSVQSKWMGQGNYSFASGLVAARHILNQKQVPTAIFAANDEMAAATLAVADELKILVPKALAIAGFDDLPLASFVSPALTTVRQPVEEMAQAAVTRLLEMQQQGDSAPEQTPLIMDVTFMVRGSTGEGLKK